MRVDDRQNRRLVRLGITGTSLNLNELGLSVHIEAKMDERHPPDMMRPR